MTHGERRHLALDAFAKLFDAYLMLHRAGYLTTAEKVRAVLPSAHSAIMLSWKPYGTPPDTEI